MESRKLIVATGAKHFKEQNGQTTSLDAEGNVPIMLCSILLKRGAFANSLGEAHSVAADRCAIGADVPHPTSQTQAIVIDDAMDWRRTSLSETEIPSKLLKLLMIMCICQQTSNPGETQGCYDFAFYIVCLCFLATPTRKMVGAFPQTPHKRTFEEFAQDEIVETGRTTMGEAATGVALVLSTAIIMTATTVCEVSGHAASAANRTIAHCIQLAQSAKRRIIELYTRIIQRVSSLRLSSRLQSQGRGARAVPSPVTHPSPALTPRPRRINMDNRSVSRLENHRCPTRTIAFRSLRATRHQDYPPITRPIAPTQALSFSSDLIAHRVHSLQDHTIRKGVTRSIALSGRRWIGGWRPGCHRGKGPRSPSPFRLPKTQHASITRLFDNPTAWKNSKPSTLSIPADWVGIPRIDAPDQHISHPTSINPSTAETTHYHKPIARKLFAETVAKYDALLNRPPPSATLAAKSQTSFAAVDFPSEDESDESYAPSASSSEDFNLSDYEDLTLEDNVAAVDQGLFSPGSLASQSYDDGDAPSHLITSHVDDLDSHTRKIVLDEHQNLEDDIIDSEDDTDSAISKLVEPQAPLNSAHIHYEKAQNGQDDYGDESQNKLFEAAHTIQTSKLELASEHSPSVLEPGVMRSEEHVPDDCIDLIEAQWQREILPVRPSQDLPTPKQPTPIVPAPTTPHPRATTPILPSSHDDQKSAKSARRYNLRTRTNKTYEIKEEDRIKAENKRKEQARCREEKRLAKQRAIEEAAAARCAIEEAENAEWILRGSRDKAFNNLVQPVNREWVAKVYSAMASSQSSQVAMSVSGQSLSRHAFSSLLPGPNDNSSAWLNDEIVTAYLDLICVHGNSQYGITQEAIKKKTSKPKYAAFSTQFMTTLRGPRGYSGVARWAGRKQIGKKDMLGCEYVFVPVHVGGNHWTMLIISPIRRTVEYFDSFGDDGSAYTDAIMKYLEGELESHFKADEWRVWSKAESARQMNGVDCGVFSVTTAKAVTLGFTPKIAFAQKDMAIQRVRMAAELINGAFIEMGKGK